MNYEIIIRVAGRAFDACPHGTSPHTCGLSTLSLPQKTNQIKNPQPTIASKMGMIKLLN